MKAEERNGTTSKSQKLLSPFHKRITHLFTDISCEWKLIFTNFTVSRKRALGETVKLEKTCWVHIKHVGISLFRTGDTSEPSFYETSVKSLDK